MLYEVKPIFKKKELVARGVHMQAQSVEDDKISFNVFVYNVQPGVHIDYKTGNNWADGEEAIRSVPFEKSTFVLNTQSKKYHLPTCKNVKKIKEENRRNTDAKEEDLMAQGYEAADCCCKDRVDQNEIREYVINTETKRFHLAGCRNEKKIKKDHRKVVKDSYAHLKELGYEEAHCCILVKEEKK